MGDPFFLVDAFTDRPFSGNPAGVVILSSTRDDGWMQSVAAEIGASETAFLLGRSLRWFTPVTEVDLCGHATLATVHVLWEMERLLVGEPMHFRTRRGPLSGFAPEQDGVVWLDFPAEPAVRVTPPPGLLEALAVAPIAVARNDMDLLVEVASAAEVRALQPDLERLALVEIRGVVVTAASDDPAYDFVSRFFAPRVGVPEDPVTGSAHCALGPWWAERLGRFDLVGYQASARGGVVRVRVGDGFTPGRVGLGGHAVTVLHGELA